MDHALGEVLTMNYLHLYNHLMEITLAIQVQISLAMRSLCKTERTCLLTKRMDTSQSLSWKSGKLNSLNEIYE
jgi:hypothetical protein